MDRYGKIYFAMSETTKGDLLTGELLGKGAMETAKKEAGKFDEAMVRGSREVAATHLQNALKAQRDALNSKIPFPRLNEEENIEYYSLRDRLDKGGLSDSEIVRFKFLGDRAIGKTE